VKVGEGTPADPFAASLARVFREHVTEEKWLIAPSRRVGAQWVDRVAWLGGPVLNVRIKTPRSLALELAEPELARRGLKTLPDKGAIIVVERILRRMRSKLEYFSSLEPTASLAGTLHRSLKGLRVAGLLPKNLRPACFEAEAKGADVARLLEAYERRIEELHLADSAQVLRIAVEAVVGPFVSIAKDVLVLLPESLALEPGERRIFDAMGGARVVPIPAEPPRPLEDGSVNFFAALGEVNEIREVLRRTCAQGLRLDQVAVLYTSTSTYVPLLYEALIELEPDAPDAEIDPPVTFAEGLPCSYSRPGRALRAWTSWIQADCPQSDLVQMVREGLLEIPSIAGDRESSDAPPGFARIAAALSSVGIGFGGERYLPRIDAKLGERSDRKLELQRARELVVQVLDCTPGRGSAASAVLQAAQKFLKRCAHCATELDRYAAKKLLEEIAEQAEWLALEDGEVGFDAFPWLSELPAQARILGSGPRPGRIHAAPLLAGGHSGRRRTFVVGLDDSRFPRGGLQDPLLLDSERRHLSPELPTQDSRSRQEMEELTKLLARLRGRITFSFSTKNLADDTELYPSPTLLALYRRASGRHDLDLTGFLEAMAPEMAAFVPRNPDRALDETECWVSVLAGSGGAMNTEKLLQEKFPHLHRGREAARHRRLVTSITCHDCVVPRAGKDLDPTAKGAVPVSPSTLEMAGKCPLRYFFRHGLGLELPEDLELDPERWLEARDQGGLLHEVFEELLRELIRAGETPHRKAHRKRAHEILAERAAQARSRRPPPSESAWERQMRELRRAVDTFLTAEEEYFAATKARPVHLEASLGRGSRSHESSIDCEEPIALDLGGGRVISLRGRVDRVDRVEDGGEASFVIWDYKTGSPSPYEKDDVLQSGRVLQPVLYPAMVDEAVKETGGRVERFGFLFLGRQGRGRRITWSKAELELARNAVEKVLDLIRNGRFLPTTNSKDCEYCDYKAICSADGPVEELTAASEEKQGGEGDAAKA